MYRWITKEVVQQRVMCLHLYNAKHLSPMVFSMSGHILVVARTRIRRMYLEDFLCHSLGRFGLRSIYMLVPEMFSNLLSRGKGMITFWTCKASIGHDV